MQLLLETEATADISVKMSTIEDTLDIHLKDSIESIKSDICNGNKENIQCQKNALSKTVNDISGDHKEIAHCQPELPSNVQDTNLELDINNDKQLELPSTANSVNMELEFKDGTVESVPSNGNSYENSNGITNTDNMNSNEQNCVDDVENLEKEGEVIKTAVDDTENQDTKNNFSNKDDSCENSEEKKVEKQTAEKQDASNSNELEIKGLSVSDTEEKNDSTDLVDKNAIDAVGVDEDIFEMAHEVDKSITEMNMLIDEGALEDTNALDKNAAKENMLQKEVQIDVEHDISKNHDNTVDLDKDKALKNIPETEVPVVSENLESGKSKKESIPIDENVEENHTNTMLPDTSNKSQIHTNTECTKTNDVESENASVVASESVTETKVTTENSVGNNTEINTLDSKLSIDHSDPTQIVDDDVIQIESKQDGEIMDSVTEGTDNMLADVTEKVVEDDVQKDADVDKPMTEVDSSKTAAEDIAGLDADKTSETCVFVDGKVDVVDIDEVKEVFDVEEQKRDSLEPIKTDEPKTPVLKLSNTLDILSDDDDEQPSTEPPKTTATSPAGKQCINIEDDDDIMLIDEDSDVNKESKVAPVESTQTEERKEENTTECTIDLENVEEIETKKVDEAVPQIEKDPVVLNTPEVKSPTKEPEPTEIVKEAKKEALKPLLPENFLKSCKKNLADMTREELEEFCILKIVESIVDRSNLGEIKSKLKSLTQNIEEQKKKSLMLTKQNRDLQLVLKSVQEEQKKKLDSVITPLKITRSVGMQVLMTEKVGPRKKPNNNTAPLAPPNNNRNVRPLSHSPRTQKPGVNQQIPVPRLVPATANPVPKSPVTQNNPNTVQAKTTNQFNGARMSPPVQKAEKRPHNRLQSVTVDLTDDEPPAKVPPRSSPAPPVRLVSSQNLLAAPRSQPTSINSPRKVYIPISGPQGQNIRPGQTIMLKSVPPPGPRQRALVPNIARGPAPNVVKRMPNNRHPAPLPDAMKQYQPPNWKALPPAPDLKLSKVENGIVISWKIEGYQEDSYEEIASYQLYAYQETSSPPNTALWKKIGDVKALPLPMACTLTQFMAGFKYYFAVRAVDVRSRLGPFSLPGSILLLNKM